MSSELADDSAVSSKKAARHLREAAAEEKCWSCGCLHTSLNAIARAITGEQRSSELEEAIGATRSRLADAAYDCLGCEVCYPALAVNELNVEAEVCPRERVEPRDGWPPLPGAYTVLRYQAPVAICTLTDESLWSCLAQAEVGDVAIVGTCQTENLGIERLIENTLANPNVRFLIACGSDSRQAVGHLPGQSLVSLSHFGVDEHFRIVEAQGKRPVLRNLPEEAIEHFRANVEVIDLVGVSDVSRIVEAVSRCAARRLGPATAYDAGRRVTTIRGRLPERMVADPAGYFVIYVDRRRRVLCAEHYTTDGVLDTVIEDDRAGVLCASAIERGLVSRLDHAAYLGGELARAERALAMGEDYIQEGAPQRQQSKPDSCGCGPCSPDDGLRSSDSA